MKDLITEQREYFKYIDNHRTSDYVLSPYLWRKDWVRPYESLYSVLCMFERLNSFKTSYAFNVICGKKVSLSNSDYLFPFLSAACNGIVDSNSNICNHVAAFFSSEDRDKVPSFLRMNEEAHQLLINSRYRVCPICHAKGYHSWLFQYRGLKVCPIHNVPLESLSSFRDDKQVDVMDSHPLLYKIDTAPIERIWNQLSLNVKSIELFTMNNHFDISAYGNTLGMEPLLNIGEEIYTRDSQDCLDIEKEMSSRFQKAIYKVTTALEKKCTEYWTKQMMVEQILKDTFSKNARYPNNPLLCSTMADILQIYITLMELEHQYEKIFDKNEVLSYAFKQYMHYVFGIHDNFSFRRFYHLNLTDVYYYHTLAHIWAEFDNKGIKYLNDCDALLYAIDDHIRYQWERYSKLVTEEGMDIYKAIDGLPAIAYLSITDADGIIHLRRLISKSRFLTNEN